MKFNNTQEIEQYVCSKVGHKVSVAVASSRKWDDENSPIENGQFYQIMPDEEKGEDFFDWYCTKRPHNQFFEKPEDAALLYLKYYLDWKLNSLNSNSSSRVSVLDLMKFVQPQMSADEIIEWNQLCSNGAPNTEKAKFCEGILNRYKMNG
jgi:hypothetical protein